jgi:uncharacterized repeat protein (TIGR01451 family)
VVDEGNNWVNLRWGPLSLYPVDGNNSPSYQGASPLANYAPQTGSSAINNGAAGMTFGTGGGAVTVSAPKTDFYGNTRPSNGGYEIGAIEVAGGSASTTDLSVTKIDNHGGSSVTVTSGKLGNGATINYTVVVTNNGPVAVTGATLTDTLPTVAALGLPVQVLTVNSWVCAVSAGATCTATGSGATRTGTVTLPVGATATYTLRGSVSALGSLVILGSTATSMSNVVSVATPAGVTDSNAANNTATDTTNLVKILSITPAAGVHGNTVAVSIAGANLGSATGVTMSGTGVTCGSVSATATAVGASCTITSGAATTNRTVTVATPDGNAFGLVTFKVN